MICPHCHKPTNPLPRAIRTRYRRGESAMALASEIGMTLPRFLRALRAHGAAVRGPGRPRIGSRP